MIDYVQTCEQAMDIIQGSSCAIVVTNRGVLVRGDDDQLVPAFVQAIFRVDEFADVFDQSTGLIREMAKDLVMSKVKASRQDED